MKTIYIALLISTSGCKFNNQGSNLKTLDNLTRNQADVVHNVCSGSHTAEQYRTKIDVSNLPAQDQRPYQDRVLAALSGLPLELQADLFNKGGIRLLPDASPTCLKTLTPDEQKFIYENAKDRAVEGCWDLSIPGTAIAVMTAKPEVIEHNTVRLFGYLLGQVESPLLTTLAKQQVIKDQGLIQSNNNFVEMLQYLPLALLADAKANPSLNVKAIRDGLNSNDPRRIGTIQNEVFADAFDSEFCNTKSLEEFRGQKFMNTYAVFHGDQKVMERLKSERPSLLSGQAQVGAPISGRGLALEGEEPMAPAEEPISPSEGGTVPPEKTGYQDYNYVGTVTWASPSGWQSPIEYRTPAGDQKFYQDYIDAAKATGLDKGMTYLESSAPIRWVSNGAASVYNGISYLTSSNGIWDRRNW